MSGQTELNKLLQRQLKRAFGSDVPTDPRFLAFAELVSQSYKHFEDDRHLLERTMELSSNELNDANEKLRREAYGQRVLLGILQDAISVLDDSKGAEAAHASTELDPGELVRKADLLRKMAENQKRTENLLRIQEARMAEAQLLANFGNWSYDFKTLAVEWSEQMYVIFNRSRELPPVAMTEFAEMIHPDDRDYVNNCLFDLKTKPVTNFQHRIIINEHDTRWLDVSVKILRNPQTGKATGMLGTVIDVTKRKNAEVELAERMNELVETTGFLDTLIDNLPVMLFVKEAGSLRYVRFNKKGTEMTGLRAEDVVGKNANELFDAEQARIYNRQDMAVLVSGDMVVERDEPMTTPSGELRFLHTRKIPIFDSAGQIKYLMSISEDITEQRRAEEQMRAAAEASDEANRAKSAFLSSMSHELRTPLNAIIGFAQILQRDPGIPAQQRGYVETMYRSGNHLLDMINDVLDLSKIEAGRFELVMEPFNIHDQVRDVESLFSLRAEEKKLQFDVIIEEGVPIQAVGDSKRVTQVLLNLVGNAIKFTDSGTIKLHVSGKPIPQTSSIMVRFEVADTGRGIPDDQIKTIFEPFRQVQGFYNEGTGLGLAICSRLVSILDGRMGVESSFGKGSVFWFEIPMETAAEFVTYEVDNYEPVVGIEGSKRWRILIVDDIPSNRAVVRALLEMVGFEVIEATNGRDAVQMAELFRPDAIFMDIMMPIMDGQEATNRIRLHSWGHDIKIIALTASGSSDRRKELVQSGFDDYVPKPFKEQWIFASLEKTIGIRFLRESASEISAAEADKGVRGMADFINTLDPNEQTAFVEAIELLDFQAILRLIRPHLVRDERAREIARHATSQNNLFFLNLSDRISI